MIQVSLVPPEHAEQCLLRIEEYLKKATEYTEGRYTPEDIYTMIMEDGDQLWVAFEDDVSQLKGFVTTKIVNYSRRRVLCMSFCGGEEFDKWGDPIIDLLRRFAKDMGCDSIEAAGRPGWAKLLKDKGYTQKWVTFELAI